MFSAYVVMMHKLAHPKVSLTLRPKKRKTGLSPVFFSAIVCSKVLPYTVGGWPSIGGYAKPSVLTKGGISMVTYSDLFQFVIMLIALIALIAEICRKK